MSMLGTMTHFYDKVALSHDFNHHAIACIRQELTGLDPDSVGALTHAEDGSTVRMETALKTRCELYVSTVDHRTKWFPVDALDRVIRALHAQGYTQITIKHQRTSKAPL